VAFSDLAVLDELPRHQWNSDAVAQLQRTQLTTRKLRIGDAAKQARFFYFTQSCCTASNRNTPWKYLFYFKHLRKISVMKYKRNVSLWHYRHSNVLQDYGRNILFVNDGY
jgi:hypothetical protein